MWNKIKSRPILKNFLFALITAILIVGATLIWLNFYTNHGEKIETPNFLGLSIEEATELAETNDLRLTIDSVYANKPKNTVILQSPKPFSDSLESWVKSNRIIYLTLVRKMEQKIKLPAIKDNSKSLASTKLTIAGLTPKWTYQPSPYKNVVLDVKYKGKSVKKGFILPKNSEVEVIIGEGQNLTAQIQIPNLIGKTISEANIELADKTFSLVALYNGCENETDSTTALITQQSPEFIEGATIAEGSEIVVTINK
ncbi:PASTA domain-containing protein [Flavobacteriales bacterium]|nr:PASTA domain-containing protein [Flavobacteriales bacterium]